MFEFDPRELGQSTYSKMYNENIALVLINLVLITGKR